MNDPKTTFEELEWETVSPAVEHTRNAPPTVTISPKSSRVAFNASALRLISEWESYKYAEFLRSKTPGYYGFRFLKNKTDSSLSVSCPKRNGKQLPGAVMTSRKVWNTIITDPNDSKGHKFKVQKANDTTIFFSLSDELK